MITIDSMIILSYGVKKRKRRIHIERYLSTPYRSCIRDRYIVPHSSRFTITMKLTRNGRKIRMRKIRVKITHRNEDLEIKFTSQSHRKAFIADASIFSIADEQ